MKRLSIIIVTYNSEKDIYDCLTSIQQQSDIAMDEIELIVVDNCSKETESMFVRVSELWKGDLKCIRNTSNGGYGQGNNVGICEAQAPIVLIMNPDVRLKQPIFTRSLAVFNADSAVGVVGMRQMKSAINSSRHSFCPTWLMNGYLHSILYAICNRLEWYIPSCMYIQGSCFFLRKEMFEKVGMFDETNFLYGEEEDIHYRMKASYGSRCFKYIHSLEYIHLTQGREPSLKYNVMQLESDLRMYAKKGVKREMIIRHYLQNNRILLLKAWFNGTRSLNYQVLKQFNDHLKNLLKA